jgi:ADP-glucose pyrophosphorylase
VIFQDAVIRVGARVERGIVDAGVEVNERSRGTNSGTPIAIYARGEESRGL